MLHKTVTIGWLACRLKQLLLQSDNVLSPPNLAQQLTSAYKESDIVRFLLSHNKDYRRSESINSTHDPDQVYTLYLTVTIF